MIFKGLVIILLVVLTACTQSVNNLESELISQRFYVATNGNNANPGTLTQPFRTIQKCASVATPGTACFIRAGTYRETIRPTNSGQAGLPILFKPYNNEKVLISGADVVKNWTIDSGNTYKAAVAWDLGAGNNQVFVDGKMMIEARFPNTTLDLFEPWGKFQNPQGSNVTYTISATNVPANLAGAKINFLPGPAWVVETGQVTASTATSFTFTSPNGQMTEIPDFDPGLYVPRNDNPYFIWGKRSLLDAAGEWFLENGQLYLWTPQSDSPASHTVEVKRRNYAFNLTDRSFIVIDGLHIFASAITTADVTQTPDAATSRNITLHNIHVRYPSHYLFVTPGNSWQQGIHDTGSGIVLFGRNHILKDSSIAFSASNGVTLAGYNHQVVNNIIHDINYAVTDSSTINTGWYGYTSRGHLIQNNTLYNTGRSVLVHRNTQSIKILNNHMYHAGLLSNDLGMTYTFQADGGGTEIAYNIVHDNFAPSESMGIYLDNGSENFVVHHNIVYNIKTALNLNLPSLNNKIYNNTLIAFSQSVNSGAARVADCNITGTELKNNIFGAELLFGYVFDGSDCPLGTIKPGLERNLEHTVNPLFINATQADFRLNTGSPAINQGLVLSPYTNSYIGSNPDLGALERGLTAFQVGASITEPCIYGDSCTPKITPRYGVRAEYFSDEELTTLVSSRREGSFDFGYYSDIPPGSFLPSGMNYSARWTSYVRAPVTGRYTFTLTADDGARLWFNNVQRIDRWIYKDPSVDSFSVNLQAGVYYPVRIDMHQGEGGAVSILEWSYPGQPKQIIPIRYLTLDKP